MQNLKLQFKIQSYKQGFTLIELLVVIVIIGILSSFLLANFVGIRQRARDGTRKSDLRQIQAALEMYRSDIGEYPVDGDFSACGATHEFKSGSTVYMKQIPCDPSGTSTLYTYKKDSSSTYTLIACLENGNDSQRDNPVKSACTDVGETGISYTLSNP